MKYSWMLLLVLAGLAACGHVNYGGVPPVNPSSTPTPTPTASPSPSACNTPSTGKNVVYVAMASAIGVVTDPQYGNIGGYGVVDTYGNPPSQASPISRNSDGTPITSQNVIQFYNAEEAGSPVLHSAYGFTGGKGFPSQPYAFPSPVPSPTGSGTSVTNWFTGQIASPVSTMCFSQTFTLKPGVYYFGDYDLYNKTTFRNVIVVGSGAERSARFPVRWRV